jgi:hypothetical protein
MDKLKAWLQRARAAVVARLVDDWRHLHRFFSVWAASAGGALLTGWQVIPDDMRSYLPHWLPVVAAYLTLACVVIGVAVKQDFTRRPPNGGADA